MTAERYGPVSILALWEQLYEEPLYLVTNMGDVDGAVQLYKNAAYRDLLLLSSSAAAWSRY
jgi:hypothetical protein